MERIESFNKWMRIIAGLLLMIFGIWKLYLSFFVMNKLGLSFNDVTAHFLTPFAIVWLGVNLITEKHIKFPFSRNNL